jgi:hypothetical protein
MKKKNPKIKKEYYKALRSCIHFHGIQIKSKKQFQKFAKHLNAIEEIIGINEVTISFENIFICPWIHIEDIEPNTHMEELLINMFGNI